MAFVDPAFSHWFLILGGDQADHSSRNAQSPLKNEEITRDVRGVMQSRERRGVNRKRPEGRARSYENDCAWLSISRNLPFSWERHTFSVG